MKICKACLCEKDESEFYRASGCKGGLNTTCKMCCSARTKAKRRARGLGHRPPGFSLREAFNESCVEFPDGCWEWIGTKRNDGYGVIRHGGKQILAHRLSFLLHTGKPVPSGMFACHKCDNPGCVNPDHLFVGTPKDNTHDAWRKGLMRPKGKAQPPRPNYGVSP